MSFAIDTTVLHSLGLSGVKIWSTTQAQSQLSDDVGWMQDLVKRDAGAMWWTRLWVLHWSLVPKLFCMSRQHHTTSTHVCNDILIELGHFMQYRQERRRISKLLDKCLGKWNVNAILQLERILWNPTVGYNYTSLLYAGHIIPALLSRQSSRASSLLLYWFQLAGMTSW